MLVGMVRVWEELLLLERQHCYARARRVGKQVLQDGRVELCAVRVERQREEALGIFALFERPRWR